jgi:predicted phosphodiesterase
MTRLAVLSDIHGNADALTAVLSDILDQSPDLLINLGDVFSGPLDPTGVAHILEGMPNLTVMGNHDRWLLDPRRRSKGWEALTFPKLDRNALGWLAGLPTALSIEGVMAVHATPQDDITYWLEEPMRDGEARRAAPEAIAARIEGRSETLFLCGHTHVPRMVTLPDGQMVVNPGSVGLPAFTDTTPFPHRICAGSPHASYAILDQKGGTWAVTHRLVPYDASRMIALAQAADEPEWAEALATGWVANPRAAAAP